MTVVSRHVFLSRDPSLRSMAWNQSLQTVLTNLLIREVTWYDLCLISMVADGLSNFVGPRLCRAFIVILILVRRGRERDGEIVGYIKVYDGKEKIVQTISKFPCHFSIFLHENERSSPFLASHH